MVLNALNKENIWTLLEAISLGKDHIKSTTFPKIDCEKIRAFACNI